VSSLASRAGGKYDTEQVPSETEFKCGACGELITSPSPAITPLEPPTFQPLWPGDTPDWAPQSQTKIGRSPKHDGAPPSVGLSTQARWALLRRLKVQQLVMAGILIVLVFLNFSLADGESKVAGTLFGTLTIIDVLLLIVWHIRIWLNTTTQ